MSISTKDSNRRGSNESTVLNNKESKSSTSTDGQPQPKLNTVDRLYNDLKQSSPNKLNNLLAALPTPETPRSFRRPDLQVVSATDRKQLLFRYRHKMVKKSVESPWKQNAPTEGSHVGPEPLNAQLAHEARLPVRSQTRITLPLELGGQPESSSTSNFQVSRTSRHSISNSGGMSSMGLNDFKTRFKIQGNRIGRRHKHRSPPKNPRDVMKQFMMLSAPHVVDVQKGTRPIAIPKRASTSNTPNGRVDSATKRAGEVQALPPVGHRKGVSQLLQSLAQRKGSI